MSSIPNHLQIKRNVPGATRGPSTAGAGAASSIAQGLSDVSSAYSQVKAEEEDKLHRSEVSRANTQFVLESMKEEQAAKDLEDYNNSESVFTANMDTKLMNIAETITDSETKERFINENLVRLQTYKNGIRVNAEAKHKDASLADLNTSLSDLMDSSKSTGDGAKHATISAVAAQRIDSAIENGWITQVQGAQYKKGFKEELESSKVEREVFAFADEQINAGASLADSMKAASSISDPKKRLAAENRIRNLHGVAVQAKKETQYETADNVIKTIQDGGTIDDIDPMEWDSMSSQQRNAATNVQKQRLADLEKKDKLYEIKDAGLYEDQIELYHQAIREGDISLSDIPEADRREIEQSDYAALQRTNEIANPTQVDTKSDYDMAAYQTMNDLLAEGTPEALESAYEFMIDNPDKLGKKFAYMSNQVRDARADKNKAGDIKTLSTYRQRIARMFDDTKEGKKLSSWVNEEFESYYERFQADPANKGKIPTLEQAKQEISDLYKQTKEPGNFYGFNNVEDKDKFKSSVEKSRAIKGTRQQLMQQSSKDTGLPVHIIRKQIGQESNFDPNAKSPTGVKGLHQITADTAKLYGFDPKRVRSNNPEDEAYQWQAYSAIMKDNVNQMGGSVKWGLVAYNAGPGNARRMRDGKEPLPIKNKSGKIVKTSKQVKSEALGYLRKILGK